jgi:VanZ family protein
MTLNETTLLPVTKLARAAAVLLTVSLFAISSAPNAGQAFPGVMHWAAHLAAYALVAFAFGLGWPKRPIVHIAILVAAIGIIHESTEIVTHSHAFETEDAIVNAIGALVGVAIQRTTQRAITRWRGNV